MFLSSTGFNRRKTLFMFLWLRPRNTYHLPQAEGVLLHAFDNRSRVCGWRCVAFLL